MKQESLYTKITEFYTLKRRMPSYAEAAKMCGFKSKDSAWRAIQSLISQGKIAKDSSGKLIPTVVHKNSSLRLLGLVEAGFGSPSEETDLDRVSLDEWLIEDEPSSFMLRIKGDSMIDAGIRENDYCIVEKTSKARVGQIIVAEVDGAWTVKFLRKDAKGYYLEPANKAFKIIRPKEDLKVCAVVKAVVRKYA